MDHLLNTSCSLKYISDFSNIIFMYVPLRIDSRQTASWSFLFLNVRNLCHIYISSKENSTNSQLYQNTSLSDYNSTRSNKSLQLYHVTALPEYSSPRTSLPYYNSTRLQLYQNTTLRWRKCSRGKTEWPVGMVLLCRCNMVIASVRPGSFAEYSLLFYRMGVRPRID